MSERTALKNLMDNLSTLATASATKTRTEGVRASIALAYFEHVATGSQSRKSGRSAILTVAEIMEGVAKDTTE